MSRVRLLLSATTDLDADAHAHWLTTRGGGEVEDVVTREWPLIARAALRLKRRRFDSDDLLVTVGEAALLAASFAWTGRLVHVLGGAPTPTECMRLRRLPAARVVASSVAATQQLSKYGVAADRVVLVAPPAGELTPTRADARRRLRLEDDAVVVALPGTIRPGSGHRLAIWACALLAYRDRSWRFLVGERGDEARVRDFIGVTTEAGSRAFVRFHEGDEPNAMAAADIALFAGDGVPETSMLHSALRHGLAIAAPRAIVLREHIPADNAFLFDKNKARFVAKAVVLASDAIRRGRVALPLPAGSATWEDVLAAV